MSGWSPRKVARLGLLAAAAAMLFVLESLAPRPLPWMRLGLGNLPVLIALLGYGPGPALSVSMAKLFLGGLLSGGLGGPGAAIGLSAGLSSLGAMAAVQRWLRPAFSPVGVSVIGAVVHQLTQLAVASVYVGHHALIALLPLSILSGVVSGTIIGFLGLWSYQRLDPGRPWGPLRGRPRRR